MWLALLAFAGCTHSPPPPVLALDPPPDPPRIELSLVDERTPEDRALAFVWSDSAGAFPEEETPTDPPRRLVEQTQRELVSRGLPVTLALGDRGLPRLHLRRFRVRGYHQKWPQAQVPIGRVLISADLETAAGRTRIAVFTVGAADPNPLSDETPLTGAVERPVSFAVKEFAAKLANSLYGYRASDATVGAMVAQLHQGQLTRERLGEVYALGFTNHPSAVETILLCTRLPIMDLRNAAVSSLGTLHATESLPLLQAIYLETDNHWRDRAAALKSIGDLQTPEALDFLAAQLRDPRLQPASHGGGFYAQVIELYL